MKKKFSQSTQENIDDNIDKNIIDCLILLFKIFVYIIFLPLLIIRFYFLLMAKNTVRWLFLNIIILFAISSYLFFCYKTLPDVESIYEYKPILSSKFYDRNDELIFEEGSEKRAYVNIKNVPQQLINAFIAAEDKTFYTNIGIDIGGIIRAAIKDIYKFIKRQKLEGASTITQQVVKNVLLTNDRTLNRKLKEIILSYKISRTIPKEKIMEIYLNHIYLGMQTYGVVSAADEYFSKTLAQLTIPEMAMLASLPKAPSGLNPLKNYNRALTRRNWVLLRMKEDGYITEDNYQNYKNTEIVIKRKTRNIKSPFNTPAFFAKSILASEPIKITQKELLNDGYKIKLTIDSKWQKIAQNALNNSLESYSKDHGFAGPIYSFYEKDIINKTPSELLKNVDEPDDLGKNMFLAVVMEVQDNEVKIGLKNNNSGIILLNDLLWAKKKINETTIDNKLITKCSDVLNVGDVIAVKKITEDSDYYSLEQIPKINGGVVILNPKTGEILSMIGGYMDKAGGFNRAVQAFRQVGSTIKPFIYASALEKGFKPTSIFMDADININIGDGTTWNPSNHTNSTNGPVTLRTGLEKSKNTVTVRVAEATGMKRIRKTIINTGINQKPENNLSVALGSVESSLINIVRAFSIFANNGELPDTYIISNIKKVNSNKNDDIYKHIYFSDCNINLKCKIKFNKEDINTPQTEISNSNINDHDNTLDNTKKNQPNSNQDVVNNKNITIISKETAYQIANILQGAVIRGTSSRLSYLNLPIAAKTGTSNGGKDLWTIAISPEIAIGVYIGYDIPVETNNYGAKYALNVVKVILTEITNDITITDFKVPDGIKFVKIDRNTGLQTNREFDKNVIFEALKENDVIDFENNLYQEEVLDITDL